MKKIIAVTLVLILSLSVNAHALDTFLLEMRDKFFEESKEIKSLFAESQDIIVLNNMWDSCIVTMNQLGAYFFMIGIFNTIKAEDMTQEAIDYLKGWLDEVNKANTKNIAKLNSFAQKVDARTVLHVEKLKLLYIDLNNVIDAELKNISLIESAFKLRKQ